MRRGRAKQLVELVVILVLVLGIRAVSAADGLGTITGRVLNAGKPLARASVTITCGAVVKKVTTDAAGAFTVSGLPAGSCTVLAGSSRATVTVAAGTTVDGTVSLAPEKTTPKPETKPAPE